MATSEKWDRVSTEFQLRTSQSEGKSTLDTIGTVILAMLGAALVIHLFVLSRRYSKMFSETHFKEIHGSFNSSLQAACERCDGSEPSLSGGTAFVSSAGLVLAISCSREDNRYKYHISLSQRTGFTTSAVANRFGFFLITILNQNKASLSPFFTQSRVHHLVLRMDVLPPKIRGFEEVYTVYKQDFRPLPFVFQKVEGIER